MLLLGYGMACPAVVCHQSVCNIVISYPTQRVEQMGNTFAPPNSLGTQTVCLKILEGVLAEVQLNGRGMKN